MTSTTHADLVPNLSAGTSIEYTKISLYHLCQELDVVLPGPIFLDSAWHKNGRIFISMPA